MAKNTQLSPQELAAFCRQMVLILNSGISYEEGLGIIALDTAKGRLKEVAVDLASKIEGRTLSAAQAETGAFPPYAVEMTAIGETSGRLEEVMTGLAEFYERRWEIERNIKSAITFPLVMAVLMFVVILLLVVKVLPIFYEILANFAGSLSPFAAGLLKVGDALSRHTTALLIAVALLLVLVLVLAALPAARNWAQNLGHTVFKKISRAVANASFNSAMSMLLKSGLDINESLNMAAGLAPNRAMGAAVAKLQEEMAAGAAFADAAAVSGVYTNVQGAMLALGVKSGSLDQVLAHIADECEAEAESRISTLLSVVEPVIAAVFSILVALILLSVILPSLGVMSAL